MRFGAIAVAGALALVARPAPARADKATPAQMRQAGDLVTKAIASSKKGDHQDAIELYMQAFDLVPQPILLSNIAVEYEQLEKRAEAVKYYCRYLDADPGGTNATYATTKVKLLQRQLGNDVDEDAVCKVKKRPPKITRTPRGDDDDQEAGSAAAAHHAQLEPAHQPSDGSDAGDGVVGGGVANDDHTEHPGLAYELGGGAAAVVGIVGISLAAYYGHEAKSLSDAIDNHDHSQPWPSTINGVPLADVDETGSRWNRDTYIFAIGGGAVLAAGVILFVIGHDQAQAPATRSVTFAPTLAPGGGGFIAVGRF